MLQMTCDAVGLHLQQLSWYVWEGSGLHWFGSGRYNFSYTALMFVVKSQRKERIKSPLFISVVMGAYRNIILMGMNGLIQCN